MNCKRKSISAFAAAAIVGLALVSSACSGPGAGSSVGEAPEAAQNVEVMAVKQEPIPDSYALSGTLRAFDEAVVSFEVDGRVSQTHVEEGDAVQAGESLAAMDASSYELQSERAKAAMQQAQAAVSQSDAAVKSAVAGVESAKETNVMQSENALRLAQDAYDKAKADWERSQALFEEGFLAEADYESARLALTQAETNLNNAKAQSKQSGAGIDSAEAALAQARAGKLQAEAAYRDASVAHEQAQLALSKTTLTAPMAGVVLEKFATAGQVTGAGQPAYRLGSIDRLKVILPVPDRDIRGWSAGQEVDVDLYGETRTGTVSSVFPSTNAGSGAVNVEVVIPNPAGDWLPGQVVKSLRTDTGSAGILVPVEAVISTGEGPFVFKSVEGKAVKTAVTLGDLRENRLHIVAGLEEGDRIVTKGAGKLFDGDRLQAAEEHDK